MNRRGFLKGAAGLLSLPLVGKMASSVKSPMVREGIANVAQVAQDVPIYFLKLVEKIKNLGKDVTETGALAERQNVKQYKDYTLTEDTATGRIEVQKVKVAEDMDYYGSPLSEEVYMSYSPGETIIGKNGNPIKTQPDYEEGTAYLRNDGPNTGDVLDEMSGVTDDIFKEVGEELPETMRLQKNYKEFRKTKADGGIINFANGGRVGRWMGGSMSAGKSTLREMLRYFSKGSKHGKSGAEMLKMVNPKQISKYLEDPNDLFMKGSSKEGIMATDMVKDYATKVEGERSMMIGELLDAAKNIRKGDKSINEYKEKIIKEMMDKGANREMAENLAEMVSGMAQKAGGRTPTPNITDQGLLELENIQKNLLTKGRSLNADGGRIELAKGGIPRALQAALKTIKSKFGDDAIKNLENEPDYGISILNDFNIARPESAIIRDKMKNFGKPGKYNEDGSIDYDYYADLLNHSEDTVVYGDESIEELLAMEKETLDNYNEMKAMYDRGELDKYAPSKFDNVNDDQIAAAVDDIFPTGDIKLDAEMAAEALVENNPQIFGDMLYEDLDDLTRSKIYGSVLEVISGNTAKMIQQSKNLSSPTKTLASMKAGKGINISDPDVMDEFMRFTQESDPKGFKDLEQKVELSNFNPKGKKGNADGGIIGLTSNPRSASNKAGVETLFKRR